MSSSSSHLLEITDDNFESVALRSPVPVLVDFTAAWCGPCRVIKPHVDAIAGAYAGRLRVGLCDTESNQRLVAQLDVRAMPTVMVFKDGRVCGQIVGAVPRAKLEALVEKVLAPSP